ncbi:MAG TPA: ABC transporter permease [Candidatus Saccharimonadales bacterium]
MHNLKTVVSFEFFRTIKKPTFWVSALSVPIMFAVIFSISFFSAAQSDTAVEQTNKEKFSFSVKDDSGLVATGLIEQAGGIAAPTKDAGIAEVKAGEIDAFFYYPADPSKQPIETYAKDVGLTKNGRYEAVAASLLRQSISTSIGSDTKVKLLESEPKVKSTTYKDGRPAPGLERMVAPAIFIALFLIVGMSLIGQMLTSTTEEKESRVTEIILTTIKARTLILGKIIGIFATGLLQLLVIIVPSFLAFVIFRGTDALSALNLSNIPIDPIAVTVGVILFVTSLMLYTGLFVATGAAVPTAKEANSFLSIFYVLMFSPGWIGSILFLDPEQPIVKVFSFFPFTAPTTLMLRNTFGNLPLHEAVIGIAIISITAIAAMALAIRIFRYGTVEYSRRLSFKEMLGRKT